MSNQRFNPNQQKPKAADAPQQPTNDTPTTPAQEHPDADDSATAQVAQPEIRVEQHQTKQADKKATTVAKTDYQTELALQGYIDAMVPNKAMNQALGGQWQKQLFGILKEVLAQTDASVFKLRWNTILKVAHDNKEGAFHPSYVFRFPTYWDLSQTEARLFRRLLTVVMETCSVKNRSAKYKELNVQLMAEDLTEAEVSNLEAFYA